MPLEINDEAVIKLVRKYQRRTGQPTANDAIKAALISGMDAMKGEALMAEKFGISDPAHEVGAVVFVDRFR